MLRVINAGAVLLCKLCSTESRFDFGVYMMYAVGTLCTSHNYSYSAIDCNHVCQEVSLQVAKAKLIDNLMHLR